MCVASNRNAIGRNSPEEPATDQSNIKRPSLSFWGAGQPPGHQIKSHHSQSPERLTQQRHLQIVVWAAAGPKEEKKKSAGSWQSNLTLLDFRSGRCSAKQKKTSGRNKTQTSRPLARLPFHSTAKLNRYLVNRQNLL